MSEGRGQQLIVGCLTASAAVASTSALVEGTGPGFRLVAGVAFAGVTLATVNMFAPDLAGGMAVLILATTVFAYGGPAFDAISTALKPGAGTAVKGPTYGATSAVPSSNSTTEGSVIA